MQNAFSFQRLGLLIKKQWFDNAKLYTLSLLALAGVLSLAFLSWGIFAGPRYDQDEVLVIFLMFLFPIGLIIASTTFSALGDKSKGAYWLSVPATHLEKLVTGIIYSVVFFLVAYVGIFLIIYKLTIFLIALNPANTVSQIKFLVSEELSTIFIVFFSLQTAFILGSIYFEKFSFIKTILSLLVIGILYSLFFTLLFKGLFPQPFGLSGLNSIRTWDGESSKIVTLPEWVERAIEILFTYIWAPVLLIATYFRLREKEI